MYRILHSEDAVRERRDQLRHPHEAGTPLPQPGLELGHYQAPRPCRTYFYLYVILDIYSRYVVGRMVAPISGIGQPAYSGNLSQAVDWPTYRSRRSWLIDEIQTGRSAPG